MHKIIIALAVTACFASPAGAFGNPNANDIPTAEVRLVDLELSTRAGQRMLQRRLSAAIEQVCGSYATTETSQHDNISNCRVAALAQANAQVAARTTTVRLAMKSAR